MRHQRDDVAKLDERSHEVWLALDSIKRRYHAAISYDGRADAEQLETMGSDLEAIGRELAAIALRVTDHGARYSMLAKHAPATSVACGPKKRGRRVR